MNAALPPEPTAVEVSQAFKWAIECRMCPARGLTALAELRAIRQRKYTWIGSEIDLMLAVDRYLRTWR